MTFLYVLSKELSPMQLVGHVQYISDLCVSTILSWHDLRSETKLFKVHKLER